MLKYFGQPNGNYICLVKESLSLVIKKKYEV